MDVPQEILQAAQALVEPTQAQAREYLKQLKETVDEQQALRKSLEDERAATARERANLDREFARREAARRAEFDESMARVTKEFTSESERLIQSIKDRVESQKLKRFAANRSAELRRAGERLRQEGATEGPAQTGTKAASNSRATADREPPLPVSTDLEEGDRVRILSLNKEGTVESVHENTYSVTIGSLRFRTERGDLQLLKQAAAASSEPHRQKYSPHPELDASQSFTPELNVIGMTADEATDRVDKYLDEAFLAGVENIRIIHGHGKGILRRAIAQLLTGHPQVEKFTLAPPEQGGGGATLVELRK
jgi:DNA mismatch repair protein MutS2